MAKDFGLYLSWAKDGHIKRDLTGPADEVSLEDTAIQDELILFSELSFTPYAQVVDMIHTSVVYLCEDSNSSDGVVDSNVYNFILQTVTDLANTLMEESPVHGLFLWTAIEDHVTEGDPVQTCRELLSILSETMQFQFVVNEVLYDLSGTESLDPEKYKGLWEMPVTDVLTLEEAGITTQYRFRSSVDYYHFLLLHFVANKFNVARCRCCGRYFIPRTKKKTLYCDRILKDEKTCKEWGPVLKHRKEVKDNEVVETFDRIKRKMYDFRNGNYTTCDVCLTREKCPSRKGCTLAPIIYGDTRFNTTEYATWLFQQQIIQQILAKNNALSLYNQLQHVAPCPDLFMTTKALLHKSSDWSHEKEWRLICQCNAPGFNQQESSSAQKRPTALYLGQKISPIYEKILRHIATEKGIPVYKMQIRWDGLTYELHPQMVS